MELADGDTGLIESHTGDAADLDLEVLVHRDIAVVAVRGELDITGAPTLRAQLDGLASEGYTRLIVDLEAVQFLDSTGLGVLVGALKRAGRGGPAVELVCTQGPTLRVLGFTGLDKAFRIHSSVGEALAA